MLLYSKSQRKLSKSMDESLDIDQVMEVPDTPDRLAAPNIIGRDCIRRENPSSMANSSENYDFLDECLNCPPRNKNKSVTDRETKRPLVRSQNDLFNSGNSESHKKNRISALRNPASFRNGLSLNRNADKTVNHEDKHHVRPHPTGKVKALSTSQPQMSVSHGNCAVVNLSRQSPHSKACQKDNSGNSRFEDWRKGKDKIVDTHKVCPSFDRGKGIELITDSPPIFGKTMPPTSTHPSTSDRIRSQKRLVRNGCISPLNVAKAQESAQKQSSSSVNSERDDAETIRELITEDNDSCRVKGKGVSNRNFPSTESDSKTMPLSSRSSTLNLNSDRTSNANEVGGGWRSTRNRTTTLMGPPLVQHQLSQINGPRHAANAHGKKQKQGPTVSNPGESSSSAYDDDSELIILGSSVEPSNARSNRTQCAHRARRLNPVAEIGEFAHEIRNSGSYDVGSSGSSNVDSDVRARQLEADELLARELQEQLYNAEAPEVGLPEALALLQEESRHVSNPRGSRRQTQTRSSQNPSNRRGTRARARSPTSTRMARLRGRFPGQSRTISSSGSNSIFRPDVDIDMRMHILEALEAFTADMGMAGGLLQTRGDFTVNDYEMLLALDENNHQHGGASADQINSLPESTVQSDNLEECSVCLETPIIGDTVRHLPCLHRFHKDCIDPWLQRRTSCPVCKSSIT